MVLILPIHPLAKDFLIDGEFAGCAWICQQPPKSQPAKFKTRTGFEKPPAHLFGKQICVSGHITAYKGSGQS